MRFLAILNTRSAFSLLASHRGIVSILFPLTLRTWSDVRASRCSIFAMQLYERFSSRNRVSLSSFSIFSMAFLLKIRTSSLFRRSRFSTYYVQTNHILQHKQDIILSNLKTNFPGLSMCNGKTLMWTDMCMYNSNNKSISIQSSKFCTRC